MPANPLDKLEVDQRKMFALGVWYDHLIACFSTTEYRKVQIALLALDFKFATAICVALFPHSASDAKSLGTVRLGSDFLLFFIARQIAHSVR